MKLLKQILIFIVFTGAIYGIFTLVTRQKEVVNTAALSAGNHEQIIKEIDRDWSGLTDWDEETYNRHNTMVAQSLNAGIINELDRKTLIDRINKAAYQKCVSAMDREFARADCNGDKLADNYAGLQTILMNERGLASNRQITEVSKVYNLYQRIIAFNNKPLGLNPRFDSSNDSWNSWTGHQDRISKQKNEFVTDPIFQNRLKNITAIRRIHDTDSKLGEARSKFYDRLSSEICSYYDNEATDLRRAKETADEYAMGDIRDKKSRLSSRMTNLRVNLSNERYLNSGHNIFNRLRYLSKEIESI
ncbi:MAG: hypothetical protein K2I25_01850 [Muribaculaceae bacterium]|nr:hypothetical protein [Muribaculaceae bacterium]